MPASIADRKTPTLDRVCGLQLMGTGPIDGPFTSEAPDEETVTGSYFRRHGNFFQPARRGAESGRAGAGGHGRERRPEQQKLDRSAEGARPVAPAAGQS